MRWQPCNELLQRCILAGLFSDPQDCIAPVLAKFMLFSRLSDTIFQPNFSRFSDWASQLFLLRPAKRLPPLLETTHRLSLCMACLVDGKGGSRSFFKEGRKVRFRHIWEVAGADFTTLEKCLSQRRKFAVLGFWLFYWLERGQEGQWEGVGAGMGRNGGREWAVGRRPESKKGESWIEEGWWRYESF